MTRKSSPVQAAKPEAVNPAVLARQLAKTHEQGAIQVGKRQKSPIEDELDQAAQAGDDSEVAALAGADDSAGEPGSAIHLAEAAVAASDASPAAAGSVPAGSAAGAGAAGAAAGSAAMGGLGVGLLVGGGLILAASGSSSSGNGNATPASNIVSGSIVGGPVVTGNGLTVNLYRADGTSLLGTGTLDPVTGQFSIDVGSYTGVVIAKVADAGVGADYIDEATGQAVDLAANLMAVGVAAGGTVTLNINPLTTVAALKAGANFAGASTGTPTTDAVNQTNTAVAQAFGLSDLTGTTVVTTVSDSGSANGAYDPTNGLTNAEKYGAVLAALSGMDSNLGGSQNTIDTLAANLTVAGSSGTLSPTALDAMMSGSATADGNTTGSSLLNIISDAIAKTSASVSIAAIAGDNAINATEAGAGVTLTGTNVAGATVELSIGGNTRAATVDGTSWSYTLVADDYTAIGQGGETITATATYTVTTGTGANVTTTTQTATATRSITVDTTAPTLAITSNDAVLTSGETATVSFTFNEAPSGFAAGDITTTGGTLSGLALTADPKVYTATFTPTPDTASGNASITVAAGAYTDAAGNNGGAGTTPAVSFDTLVPTLAISSNVSAVKSGETATITFTFSEAPIGFVAGDVTTTGGTLSGLAVTGDAKVYTATFTPTPGTASGNASITVAAGNYTDAAGNNGNAGTTPAISIDTQAPTLVITSNDAALKVGETATITFTFSEDPINFADGDITVNGGTLGAISGSGLTRTATFTPTPNFEGNASITVAAASYSDAAGNTGGAGTTPALAVDTQAPTIDIVATAGDDIINSTEALGAATVTGTTAGVEDGRTVTVHLNGHDYTTTVTANAWTATVPLIDVGTLVDKQTYAVTADVSDAAGNAAAQASQNVQVFTTGPAVTITPITGDNRISAQEHGAGITIAGTTSGAENGSTVSVTLNGQSYDTTVTNNAWSVTVDATAVGNLQDGAYPVAVSVTSASGPGSQSQTLTVDTTAPNAPAITGYTTDTGVQGDNLTSNTQPTFSGTAEANATVNLTITKDGNAFTTTTVTANAQGAWTFQPGTALADGVYAMTATATDAAGNTGAASGAATLTIDHTAPATPAITGYTTDTGVQGDFITSNTQPTFSGTAAANATVNLTITKDGNAFTTTTVTANAQGAWTFQPGTALADGVYAMTATATDAAGNTGAASSAATLTIDTTAPAAPAITGYTTDTGVQGDFITGNTQPTFSGTAEANATVNLTITKDGNAFASTTVTANAQGAWTFQPGTALADGVYAMTATATDAAGNTGVASSAATLTIDTAAPTLVSFGTSTADGSYNAGDTIALTAIMGESVRSGSSFVATLNGGGTVNMSASADGTTLSGSYVVQAGQNSADLTVASYTTGSMQDLAGNAMTSTTVPTGVDNLAANHAIVVDTISPSFTSADTAIFANQGTGTVYTAVATDASNAVSYSLTGTDAAAFNIDANTGAMTFKTAPNTAAPIDTGADNVYNFNAVATDQAGNSSSQAVAISVVNAPSLASALDNVSNFEITSNIVLTASENVTAVANKFIHLINDGGTGFHGESNVNTQDILVTDTSKVTIVNNIISINPQFDLDFNNNYHITIDAGAFLGVGSGMASVAIDDAQALNFSTVNPSATATAAASQAMNSGTDAMVAGHNWWDAEGNGVPGGTAVVRDFSEGNNAIAANDLATTGIATNDFYIAVNNFGVGDLIYVDNHGDNAVQRQSDFNAGLILDMGTAPTPLITGASSTATGQNGGQFDITLAGMTNSFTFTTDLQTLLQVSYQPILYG